jgi:methionine sulfoxide reductase catalytic subunit
MLIRRPEIPASEITDEATFLNRREFVSAAGLAIAGLALPLRAHANVDDDKPTSYEHITTYNNYYEFGTDKSDPSENSKNFRTKPWTVAIEGHVNKPATYNLEDFVKPYKQEERIYRHRCVEGWSMVIPWYGFPLKDLINKVEPTAKAKYEEFTTILDPKQMPGQQKNVLDWPYVEGLRMDEALHPLTIMATGLYGKPLPNQNGAPLRVVIPWKYGFKSAKAIVKIRFVEEQPTTTWMKAAPEEYGFYSNVNPTRDGSRGRETKERRIGELRRRTTLMFNGYGDQVASLYSGMDLIKYY